MLIKIYGFLLSVANFSLISILKPHAGFGVSVCIQYMKHEIDIRPYENEKWT